MSFPKVAHRIKNLPEKELKNTTSKLLKPSIFWLSPVWWAFSAQLLA